MFLYDPPLNPPINEWEDNQKPTLIKNTIEEICKDILFKGKRSSHAEIYDLLYEYIEDNIEKYIPGRDL